MSDDPQTGVGQTADGNGAKRLVIRNLNKSFGVVHVVKNLSLDVAPGEFLVLLGPSGCGKTTALRMVAGLEEVDTGSIHLGEVDVTRVLPKYRDVAMVFQSYALYPHKTVAENIGFPLKVRGVDKPARGDAVREAAAQVHMDTLLDRYPRQLSGGQQQRVALARALAPKPDLILMDEPFSNLNRELRRSLRQQTVDLLRAQKITGVFVTHDREEAFAIADTLSVLAEGKLLATGEPLAQESMHARRLPGDGDIDLLGLVRTLDAIGCSAPLGAEVFSDDLAGLTPAEVGRRVGEATRALLASART